MKKPKANSKKQKMQANHFSFQNIYKYRNWLLLTILLVIPFLFVLPSNSVVRTDTCGTVGSLQNGSFEDFTVGTANSPSGQNFWHGYAGGPNMFLFLPDDEDDTPNGLPNWKTTATDDTIELQRQISSYTSYTNISNVTNTYFPARSGLQTGSLNSSNYFDLYGPQPAAGNHWAELNANQSAALYQDIVFSGGSNVFWSLKHRGRYFGSGSVFNRTDEMRVEIGPVGTLTEQTTIRKFAPTNSDRFTGEPTFSTTSTSVSTIQTSLTDGWNMYRGQYTVPGSGNQTIRFQFRSNTSGSGGNLLDNIEFTPFLACPVTRTVTFGTPDTLNAVTTAGVTYGVNQTITSTTSATNPNGSVGTVSRSGNEITFTPVSAGNSQTVDYTASMTFSGTTYTDEARITYNVSATVPGAPTSLSATPSGSQVVLSWTAPSNNGGVAISDYVVEFQQGSGSWQTFSDGVSSSTSATITGLTGSSNYNFRVSAKNDGSGYTGPGTTGTSAASSVLAVNAWQCSNLNQFNGITGLILWLRADCVNGTPTQPSDGTSITTWEDISGSNNDATTVSDQTAPTLQSDSGNLINGLPVLNFTRTSDSAGSVFEVNNIDIRATSRPDVSIFAVYKTRRTGGSETDNLGVWGNDDGAWDRFFLAKFQDFGNDGLISLGPVEGSTTSGRITGAGTDLTTRLLTAIYDGNVSNGTNSGPTNASKIYFGGTLVRSFTDSTNATAAKEKLYIGWDGNDSTFRGDIAEFIVFNRALESDLPTINEYLNSRYNLVLDVSTNLPDVIPVHPLATTINFPSLTLTNSTNAMICFSQVANSGGTALSGSPTIAISRSSTTSGVTENITSNLWRYNGTRANVQTQINSINISGTSGAAIASTGSKWLRVHVTSATSSASDCQDSQVNKVVEIRSLGVDTNRRITVDVN